LSIVPLFHCIPLLPLSHSPFLTSPPRSDASHAPPLARPATDSVKQTMQGRMAAATQVQAAQYLKPLMKSLRQRVSALFVFTSRDSPGKKQQNQLITGLCQSPSAPGPPIGRAPPVGRDRPSHADEAVSTRKRRLLAVEHRERRVADRGHHGRVGGWRFFPSRAAPWSVAEFWPTHRIHERSAREKIGIDSVAHVLNDEVSRKYIQSVKR
jgi:pre-mRNA-splicing factor 18